jgi:hypothetical protein
MARIIRTEAECRGRATDGLAISLRAFVTDPKAKPRSPRKPRQSPASKWTLVFDTETTTDPSQRLRFGSYQLREGLALDEAGVFFDPDVLSEAERRTLEAFATSRDLKCMTHTTFVEDVFFRRGYDLRATIVGFNLPFDLSRLALGWAPARGKMRGGFSFKLSEKRWRPRVQIKHLSARAALMQFTSPTNRSDNPRDRREGRGFIRRGSFVDVKTIAGALLSRSFTLGKLADHLKTATQKATTDEHGGVLSDEYLGYAVTDVQATWECHLALSDRFSEHGLGLTRLSQILSEASLGKAYLRQMGIRPWRELQPDFPVALLGVIMSSYFGGRAEVHRVARCGRCSTATSCRCTRRYARSWVCGVSSSPGRPYGAMRPRMRPASSMKRPSLGYGSRRPGAVSRRSSRSRRTTTFFRFEPTTSASSKRRSASTICRAASRSGQR